MGYAPQAIHDCYTTIHVSIPDAIMAGIYGDQPGYHGSRNDQDPADYSVQLAEDQQGSPDAGSALDVTMYDDADMKRATQNLIDATYARDHRLRGLRSFFGTVDGVTVTGMDVPGCDPVTSDPSHLFHVHLSGLRKYADDKAAWQDIAHVFTGQAGGGSTGDDDMGTFETTVCTETQTLNNTWKTLAVANDGSQSWFRGPCKFQAQAQVSVSGLTAPNAVKLRWATFDVRVSDGYTKPESPNVWPVVEMLATSGGAAGSVVQFGEIGKPPDGYQRRLRLQACADQGSGVALTYIRASSFQQ